MFCFCPVTLFQAQASYKEWCSDTGAKIQESPKFLAREIRKKDFFVLESERKNSREDIFHVLIHTNFSLTHDLHMCSPNPNQQSKGLARKGVFIISTQVSDSLLNYAGWEQTQTRPRWCKWDLNHSLQRQEIICSLM